MAYLHQIRMHIISGILYQLTVEPYGRIEDYAIGMGGRFPVHSASDTELDAAEDAFILNDTPHGPDHSRIESVRVMSDAIHLGVVEARQPLLEDLGFCSSRDLLDEPFLDLESDR